MSVYTMGIWQAKTGREDEFAAPWWEFALWTGKEFQGGQSNGTLLRDRDHVGCFVSLGPWESADQVAAWRAHPGFQQRVTQMNQLLESFAPAMLDPVPPPAEHRNALRTVREAHFADGPSCRAPSRDRGAH